MGNKPLPQNLYIEPMESIIHTAIVEDDPEIRQLLQLLVGNSPGFRCDHAYPDAESAIAELNGKMVDVILMDIELPGKTGIECVAELREMGLKADILMLSVRDEEDAIFRSLCAGASGYLLKGTPPVQLLQAIRECKDGGSPMSPSIARKVVASFQKPTPSAESHDLSEREAEVLQLLCAGENYKTIADQLFVSANTVKAHIKHIYAKLHVRNRAEAVSKATRKGWV